MGIHLLTADVFVPMNAAREVRTLIGASLEQTQAGHRLVGDAGGAMQEIVTGSGELNGLMEQIAVSTSEQEKGIDQITLALNELETVTQSNITVVEELARSSDILKRQVIELQSRTQNFRVGDEQQAASPRPAIVGQPLQPAVAGSSEQNFWQSF